MLWAHESPKSSRKPIAPCRLAHRDFGTLQQSWDVPGLTSFSHRFLKSHQPAGRSSTYHCSQILGSSTAPVENTKDKRPGCRYAMSRHKNNAGRQAWAGLWASVGSPIFVCAGTLPSTAAFSDRCHVLRRGASAARPQLRCGHSVSRALGRGGAAAPSDEPTQETKGHEGTIHSGNAIHCTCDKFRGTRGAAGQKHAWEEEPCPTGA